MLDTVGFAAMTRIADRVYLGTRVKEYLVALVSASRTRPEVRIGVSPRGTIALAGAAKAWAAANGRHFVAPDDVRLLAPHVLPHRIILTPEAELQGLTSAAVVEEILKAIPVDETDRG